MKFAMGILLLCDSYNVWLLCVIWSFNMLSLHDMWFLYISNSFSVLILCLVQYLYICLDDVSALCCKKSKPTHVLFFQTVLLFCPS